MSDFVLIPSMRRVFIPMLYQAANHSSSAISAPTGMSTPFGPTHPSPWKDLGVVLDFHRRQERITSIRGWPRVFLKMKTNLVGIFSIVAAGLLAGCSTFSSRVEERRATFAALSHDDQIRLKAGTINVGDTPDMVYLALGKPDEKRINKTAAGNEEAWIYRLYSQEYRGEAYYRWLPYHAWGGRRARYFYGPISEPVYESVERELARVVFRDGKVSLVSQTQGK